MGQAIGPWVVAEVRRGAVVLDGGERRVVLSVGASSSVLYGTWPLSGEGFDLIGICQVGEHRFALVRPRGAQGVQQLRVRDRFGRGSVAKITDDRIVLKWDGAERVIALGGRFTPKDEAK